MDIWIYFHKSYSIYFYSFKTANISAAFVMYRTMMKHNSSHKLSDTFQDDISYLRLALDFRQMPKEVTFTCYVELQGEVFILGLG